MGTWTRNYYNLMTSLILADCAADSETAPADYTPPIRVRDISGNYMSPYVQAHNGVDGSSYNVSIADAGARVAPFQVGKGNATYITTNSISGIYTVEGFQFGSGTNNESYEDYCLQTPITSGLTLADPLGNLEPSALDGQSLKSKRSFTITNSTASPITVNEIGVFVRALKGGGNPYWVLVYREKLDEAIVLNGSESIILSFEKDGEIFNYTPYT